MEPAKDASFRGAKDDIRRRLTLLDTTSIIVGIIIGSTIFKMSPTISASAANFAVWAFGSDQVNNAYLQMYGIAGIWILGGLIALMGALCYAELATALPQEGGSYVYLKEAFGRRMAFAFAWTEFWIVRPGTLARLRSWRRRLHCS